MHARLEWDRGARAGRYRTGLEASSHPNVGLARCLAGRLIAPIGGDALRPDLPLARAYNEATRALSKVDDNPLIGWEYRVWCETGYRSPGDAGSG